MEAARGIGKAAKTSTNKSTIAGVNFLPSEDSESDSEQDESATAPAITTITTTSSSQQQQEEGEGHMQKRQKTISTIQSIEKKHVKDTNSKMVIYNINCSNHYVA
jgi:hypothetical protein